MLLRWLYASVATFGLGVANAFRWSERPFNFCRLMLNGAVADDRVTGAGN